jgi:DNA-binding transcriptional LysR family regulator
MDRFTDLQTFVHIVSTGSISGAAEHMGVAKSAVSRRLAELEAHLGVQLVRRTTRRLSLTESGRGFYERCVRLLTDLAEAEQDVLQAHAALRGTLRVALPLSFGLLHLAPAIQDFVALHPGVEFDLDFNDRQVDLLQEGFDVAIRIAQLPDSSLIARRIAPIRQVVCASPDYFAIHGRPQQPAELARHACLAYSNLASPGTWSYRQADGQSGAVKIPIRLKSNNGDFLISAALAGLGIIMQPTFYVHRAIASGALIPVLTDYRWPEINAYALYPSTRHLSRRVRTFVDFLVQRFDGIPYWDHALDIAAGVNAQKNLT